MPRETFDLQVDPPFSLKATVLAHGWHECAPMSWSEGGRCFQWISRRETDVFRISVQQPSSRRRRPTLAVTIDGPTVNGDLVEPVSGELRVVLGLDHNLSAFYDLCAGHPTLHILPRLGAGRILRSASMTENIIKTICGTNVNWDQAVRMINRIAQLGPHLRHFRNLSVWPTPREILKAGEPFLLGVARVGYRAPAILGLCRCEIDGPESLEGLEGQGELDALAKVEPTDVLRKRLMAIRGIGPASAGFLLSILGHHDHLSIDSATLAHVSRTHLKGKRATPRHVEDIYAPYGRWKNLVYWFEHWLTWGTAREIVEELT